MAVASGSGALPVSRPSESVGDHGALVPSSAGSPGAARPGWAEQASRITASIDAGLSGALSRGEALSQQLDQALRANGSHGLEFSPGHMPDLPSSVQRARSAKANPEDLERRLGAVELRLQSLEAAGRFGGGDAPGGVGAVGGHPGSVAKALPQELERLMHEVKLSQAQYALGAQEDANALRQELADAIDTERRGLREELAQELAQLQTSVQDACEQLGKELHAAMSAVEARLSRQVQSDESELRAIAAQCKELTQLAPELSRGAALDGQKELESKIDFQMQVAVKEQVAAVKELFSRELATVQADCDTLRAQISCGTEAIERVGSLCEQLATEMQGDKSRTQAMEQEVHESLQNQVRQLQVATQEQHQAAHEAIQRRYEDFAKDLQEAEARLKTQHAGAQAALLAKVASVGAEQSEALAEHAARAEEDRGKLARISEEAEEMRGASEGLRKRLEEHAAFHVSHEEKMDNFENSHKLHHDRQVDLQNQLHSDRQALVTTSANVQDLTRELRADQERRVASVADLRLELSKHVLAAGQQVASEMAAMQQVAKDQLSGEGLLRRTVEEAVRGLRLEVQELSAHVASAAKTPVSEVSSTSPQAAREGAQWRAWVKESIAELSAAVEVLRQQGTGSPQRGRPLSALDASSRSFPPPFPPPSGEVRDDDSDVGGAAVPGSSDDKIICQATQLVRLDRLEGGLAALRALVQERLRIQESWSPSTVTPPPPRPSCLPPGTASIRPANLAR
eukprot:TRINITY_DN23972_c0_g1_i1.p1 TRINITY_DN23972_c0_g1~~TRINITY_DN23972_c0_g1_i1.p1  ORF type:complete len:743 (-),score=186.32 TRINITY_DN23972_c0_g1_i1:58-2286(-)